MKTADKVFEESIDTGAEETTAAEENTTGTDDTTDTDSTTGTGETTTDRTPADPTSNTGALVAIIISCSVVGIVTAVIIILLIIRKKRKL